MKILNFNEDKQAIDELRNFIEKNGLRKPSDWDDLKVQNINSLSSNAKKYLKSLPFEIATENRPFNVKIKTENMIHKLKYNYKQVYLINTEGYNYPRYMVRIK